MVSKVVVIFAIFAIIFVNAVEEEHHEEEDHGPVEYEFSYSVHDDHTKDIKSHQEHRKDDKVIGSYELIDSDGHKRRVEYQSDKHNGFTAVVHREPTDIKVPIPEHHQEPHRREVEHHKLIVPIVHHAKVVPVVKVKKAILYHHHQPAGHDHVSYSAGHNHVSYHSPNVIYHY